MFRKPIILLSSIILILGLVACSSGVQVDSPTAIPESTTTAEESPTAETESAASSNVQTDLSSLANLQSAYEEIYNKVLPSVVSIEVSELVSQSTESFPDFDFPFDFQMPEEDKQDESNDSGEQQYQDSGEASGFVWDTEGHIVTNNHVVEDADLIRVRFADGSSALAEVVGTDPSSDLAVIQVDVPESQLTPIEIADSTQVKVGQIVVAIGNPFGLSNSMTTGIVSALGRSITLETTTTATTTGSFSIPDVIQTDAAVNKGNSGGVLVDIYGELVGVTTAIISTVETNSGVSYVVPSVIIQKIVPFLIEDGSYQQPYIGLTGGDLTPEYAEAMGLDENQQGALVVDVMPNTPAEEAGLQGSDLTTQIDGQTARIGGDVITSVDGQAITDFEDLTAYLARYTNVGQTIELTFIRDGAEQQTSLTLIARPGEKAVTTAETSDISGTAWLGVTGISMNSEIASAMDLKSNTKGVLVEEITSGSPADEAGLRGSYKPFELNGEGILIGGDIITAVDSTEVSSVSDLQSAIGGYNPDDEVTLSIIRDGKESSIKVTLAERE